MSEKKQSINQITGLRGVIAFQIAYILHWAVLFQALPDFHNPAITLILGGTCGVVVFAPNVFFIMSGYLIHKSYNRRISDGVIDFWDFILPKMKKIYPLVITTAIITWILQNLGKMLYGAYPLYAEGGEVRNSVLSLLLSIIGMQSGYISDGDSMSVNGPAWFVAVLFLNYGIYYFVTMIVKKKWIQNTIYALLVISGIVLMIIPQELPLLYYINGRGYFSFFIGVLMLEVVQIIEMAEEETKILWQRILYVIMCILFAISFYICCLNSESESYEVFLMMVLFFPSIVYLLLHGYVLSWIFSRKCFVLLGKAAMPMFLCNFPTNVAIRLCDMYFGWNLDYTNPWIWLIHIVISMIFVVIFHFIFEVSWKKQKLSD